MVLHISRSCHCTPPLRAYRRSAGHPPPDVQTYPLYGPGGGSGNVVLVVVVDGTGGGTGSTTVVVVVVVDGTGGGTGSTTVVVVDDGTDGGSGNVAVVVVLVVVADDDMGGG
jgi:hypothetical protein